MRFPYGLADFRKIREEGYFYVDRTDRIPLIEEAGSQLLSSGSHAPAWEQVQTLQRPQ